MFVYLRIESRRCYYMIQHRVTSQSESSSSSDVVEETRLVMYIPTLVNERGERSVE